MEEIIKILGKKASSKLTSIADKSDMDNYFCVAPSPSSCLLY